MKAKFHKLIGTAVLGLALLLNSLPAWAGYVSTPGVFVGSSAASGSMAGARYSADSQQYIGCRFSNTFGPYVVCVARDNTGKSLLCTSNESIYFATAKAITDFSLINFSVTPGSTSCSSLWVENYSMRLR